MQKTFILLFSFLCTTLVAQEKVLPVFCFPPDQLPVIDGKPGDWDIVPDHFWIGMEEMTEDEGNYDKPDPNTLDVRVKVAWDGLHNRLYFLYEAWDNYWSFSQDSLMVDMFEVVVDGDRSGGPFIDKWYPFPDITREEAWHIFHGRHAQNYHIYTPPYQGEWCWYWGPQQWLKEYPYSESACQYDFREGESGRLILEFYITPFDYASPRGAEYSVVSDLYENKRIGLSWAVIDYDNSTLSEKDGFWNLSRHHNMYGDASLLRTFRLMPFKMNNE